MTEHVMVGLWTGQWSWMIPTSDYLVMDGWILTIFSSTASWSSFSLSSSTLQLNRFSSLSPPSWSWFIIIIEITTQVLILHDPLSFHPLFVFEAGWRWISTWIKSVACDTQQSPISFLPRWWRTPLTLFPQPLFWLLPSSPLVPSMSSLLLTSSKLSGPL